MRVGNRVRTGVRKKKTGACVARGLPSVFSSELVNPQQPQSLGTVSPRCTDTQQDADPRGSRQELCLLPVTDKRGNPSRKAKLAKDNRKRPKSAFVEAGPGMEQRCTLDTDAVDALGTCGCPSAGVDAVDRH